MTTANFSQLQLAGPLTGTEIIPLMQTGITVQQTSANLAIATPVNAVETAHSVVPVNLQYPLFDARRYGIVGDGVTDNTAAMTSAHSMGRPIIYQAGNFNFTHFTMPSGGIVGQGIGVTNLQCTDLTATDAITVNTNLSWFNFQNFSLQVSGGTKAGGFGMVLNPASSYIDHARFINVQMVFPSCLNLVACFEPLLLACDMNSILANGISIQVANTSNPDLGDGYINGCKITSNASGGTGILQVSGGGLKIVNCKLNNGAYGYHLAAAGQTSDLLISNCSIEGYTAAGIMLERPSGVTTWNNIVISGNQIASAANPCIGIQSNGQLFIEGLSITGNVISVYDTHAGSSGIALDFITAGAVVGNAIWGNAGTSTGMLFGANNVHLNYAANTVYNTGTLITAGNATNLLNG